MRRSRIRLACEWVGVVGVVFLLYRFVDKYSLIEVINRGLPMEEAGMLRGMVLGDKGGLDKEIYQKLKDSGLVHLVVASGANVMLLTGLIIENLAGWLGRKRAVISALIIVWGYAGMAEWQAPVVRAVIFISVFYWAQLLGRRFDLGRGLGLTVVIMLLANGAWLADAGFWLSILAFIGVITRKLRITNYELRIVDDLVTTVWVGVWVTPVLGLVFGRISLMAPVTNVMVLFLVEYITVVGAVGAVVGLGWGWLGEKILWLALPALRYMIWVATEMKRGTINLRFNWLMLAGWYLILIYFLIKRNDIAKKKID